MGSTAKIPIEDVVNWIDSLFYLDTVALKKKGIKCTLSIYNGLKLEKTIKFKPKPFEELLDKISDSKKCSSTVSVNGDSEFTEDAKVLEENEGKSVIKRKKMKKRVHMDIALRYDPTLSESFYDTYCNDTNTIDNGTHKDIVEQVYCRYLQSKANDTLTDKQKEKMKVTWEDIKSGLVCVINLSTNGEVGFVGNAKRAINAETLVPYITDVTRSAITEYFDNNQDILSEYIKIVKLNAKARIEAQKTKAATQIERLNNFKAHEMRNYTPCVNTGKKFKELDINGSILRE